MEFPGDAYIEDVRKIKAVWESIPEEATEGITLCWHCHYPSVSVIVDSIDKLGMARGFIKKYVDQSWTDSIERVSPSGNEKVHVVYSNPSNPFWSITVIASEEDCKVHGVLSEGCRIESVTRSELTIACPV